MNATRPTVATQPGNPSVKSPRISRLVAVSLAAATLATLTLTTTAPAAIAPKVALHVQAAAQDPCQGSAPTISCIQYETSADFGIEYDVYVVLSLDPSVGTKGLEFGIDYDTETPSAILGVTWTTCADQELASATWPDPGSHTVNTFETCQDSEIGSEGVHAIIGVFTMTAYAPDLLSITPRSHNGLIRYINCTGSGVVIPPENAGAVRFSAGGSMDGVNPCGLPGPPVIVGADVVSPHDVHVFFSEPLAFGSDDPTNFEVFPTVDPSNPLPVISAVPFGATIELAVTGVLQVGTEYTLRVNNVEDRSGELISPNSTIAFVREFDETGPVLVSAEGFNETSTVTAGFDEEVGAGSDVPDNFQVYPTGDVNSPFDVVSASPSGKDVQLGLNKRLSGGILYTVVVNDIEDLAGNPIAPNSSLQFRSKWPVLTNTMNPLLAVHVQPWPKNRCAASPHDVLPSDFVVTGTLESPYALYFVATNFGGTRPFSRTDFGITFGSDLYVGDWSSCADSDLQDGAWPGSGTGISVHWLPCRENKTAAGAQVVAGSLYVHAYGPSQLSVTERPLAIPPRLSVWDCENREFVLSSADGGMAGFGGLPGYSPCCEPVSVQSMTWGGIKRQFANPGQD